MVFFKIIFTVLLLLYSQAMVNVQMLSELEEIIQFKLVPERREAIKRTWWNRLQVSDEYSLSSSMKIGF